LPVETRQRRGATRVVALGDESDSRTQPRTDLRVEPVDPTRGLYRVLPIYTTR
jgi:hypothetical protein